MVATWNDVGDLAPSIRAALLEDDLDPDTLRVPPLPAHEQETLVDGLLGLEPELRRAVLERSGGMPLFAVELVSDEVRRGRLEPGPDGWRLRDGAAAQLPDGLHALWMERAGRALDDLGAGSLELLELAATLGQDIDLRELRAVARRAQLPPPPTLVERLREHNLAEGTRQGLRLGHGLLRESLLRSAREHGRLQGWHDICADTLQDLHADGRASAAERIGHHLRAAGRLEASLEPLLRAAERRRDRGDYDRALALLQTREQSIEEAGGDPERSAEGKVVQARIAGNRAHFDQAAALCEDVLAAAEEQGWGSVVAEAMRTLAFAWWQQGRYDEAEALYRDARRRFEDHGAPLGLGRCELGLGIAAYHRGDLREADQRFLHAHSVFRKAGILRGVVDALGWRGILSRRLGHNGEAQQRFREAMEAAESAGLRFAANAVRNSLAVTYRSMKQPRKAEAVFRRVLAEAELLGTGEAVWPCINLGLLRLADGEPQKAAVFLRRALAMLEDSGRVTFAGGVRVALMACAGAQGQWSEWADHHAAALAAFEASSVPHPDVGEAAEGAARSARDADRPDEERQALHIALSQWQGLGNEEAIDRVQQRLSELAD